MGSSWDDPWHWLRDPKYPAVEDPEVLAYLKAENAYFDGWEARHQGLLDELFAEMKGRIKEDDSSVPIRDGDFSIGGRSGPARNIAAGTGSPTPAAAIS